MKSIRFVFTDAALTDLNPRLDMSEVTLINTALQRCHCTCATWLKPGVKVTRRIEVVVELDVAALFQMRDRFRHHAMTEMALSHPQEFRAAPCLMDAFDFRRWSNRIEFSGYE
jgi:hypothetical protein